MKAYLSINDMVKRLSSFTTIYKDNIDKSTAIREALCLQSIWKAMLMEIDDEDLYAGNIMPAPIGLSPQDDSEGAGYYIRMQDIDIMLKDEELEEQNRVVLLDLIEFWKQNNSVKKCKDSFGHTMKEMLPSDNYATESGVAFTLWRIAGVQMDYKKLVTLGIRGLRSEIKEKQYNTELGACMEIALDVFSQIALFYRDKAQEKNKEELAEALQQIASDAPRNLFEAIQLVWLYTLVAGTRNFGRLDDALSSFACESEHQQVELFIGLYKMMRKRKSHTYFDSKGYENYRYDTRIVIGGKGRVDEKNADKIALSIMEASARFRDTMPQLALRFYDGQNPALYSKALDILASGYTFPMLYNDAVNIPSAAKAFEVSEEEAVNIIQYGCGEYVFNHRSIATPSAVINLLHALLDVLECNDKIDTFDNLWDLYCKKINLYVEQLALHEKLEYDEMGKQCAFLFMSMLMDDCIERGKTLLDGGIRYLDGTLETYGNTNTADSLYAIKELVFDKKEISLEELKKALNSNFEGYENLRNRVLDLPKYGNNNCDVDEMYIRVHNQICSATKKYGKMAGLHQYLVVVINNDANTLMGLNTAASPDGRLKNEHLNPGNNPMPGRDKNGVTSMLLSIVKPSTEIHAGAVQNLKLSKELFEKHRKETESLIDTYFKMGGAQLMLTVVSRGELEDAMKHPENYQNLIVRVGGFSERFVNLPTHTQLEVLNRTLY